MTVHDISRLADRRSSGPVIPSQGRHRPLGLGEIILTSGFWERRQRINTLATLGHCEEWMERLGWLANFDRVAEGTTAPDRPGWCFSDSEVYKLMEALAWEYGRTGDQEADATLHRLTARVARAQDPDGYLNTCYGHGDQEGRYTDLENGHELYCTGHLLQAAVARARTVGLDDPLVEVARRAADHVCDTFGNHGRQQICGHPEIEVGLAELSRALEEPRYLEQSRIFLERRGRGTLRGDRVPSGSPYFQDDVPIREADAWRGHAVRALYLVAGAVDVAVETADDELLAALERQWEHTVSRRTYLTGGMGSRHQDEGFGEDWELPPDRAYCESCAGIASVMVSWRLYLATGEVRYADLIERTLYNVVAVSPGTDGRAFFYANPLHQRIPALEQEGVGLSPRAESGVRAPWFDVSCCPTNLARTFASWQTFSAGVGEGGVTLLQYSSSTVRASLDDGRIFGFEVRTDYPDDGLIRVRITDAPSGKVGLRLRVPDWAEGAELQEGGTRRRVDPGFAVVERRFVRDEEILLHLPMKARLTWPDPRIDAVRGCVAVERGPLVHCVESIDLPEGVGLDDVLLDPRVAPYERAGQVRARGVLLPGDRSVSWSWPYGDIEGAAPSRSVELTLSPYHEWARRGPTAMRVWIPVLT